MRSWSFEPGHTAAEFVAWHMMVTRVRGAFKDIHGRVHWDPDDCMQTTFEGEVEVRKLWTGEPVRDAHLRSADFFDVENHPWITFSGRFTERVGDTHFKATAELAIHGETNEIPLDVIHLGQWKTPYWAGDVNKGEMTRIGFALSGRVNRHDWHVSWNDELPGGGVVVSNEIDLAIDVEAILDDDLRTVGLEDAIYAPAAERGAVTGAQRFALGTCRGG
jgi:polyisoprenoid-binding protein YceI